MKPILRALVVLWACTAVLAACGSCGKGSEPAPAPLEIEPEKISFSSLPQATNPFTTESKQTTIEMPDLALPDKTPLLIRLRSPDRLDQLLQAYSEERSSMGEALLEWKTASLLGKVLAFDPAEWMARDKPVTALVVDPMKHFMGEALVMGIRDTDALLAALPKGGFDDDEVRPEGHAAVYRTETGVLYVDFVGSHVVFTKSDKLFAEVKDFITTDLVKVEATHDLEVIVDVNHLSAAFAKEIALTRADPSPGGTRGSGVPFITKSALLTLVDGFERLSMQIDLVGGHFKVRLAARQSETPAESMQWVTRGVQALSSQTAVQIAGLPKGVWGAGSATMEVSGENLAPFREDLSTAANLAYGDLLDLTPAEREASAPLWGRLTDLVRGGIYGFAFEQEEFATCVALVLEVADSRRVRFLVQRLLETFFFRIVPRIQDEEISIADMPFPDGDFRSLDVLLLKLNEMYKNLGIEFYQRTHTDAGRGLTVETLGLRFDPATRAAAAKAGERSMAEYLGNQLELAMAFRGNLVSLVLSPTGTQQAALLASGSFGTGGGPFRTVEPGDGALFAFALDRVLTSVPWLWPKAIDVVTPDQVKGDTSLALRSHGRTLQGTISLPIRSLALLETMERRSPRKREKKAPAKTSP